VAREQTQKKEVLNISEKVETEEVRNKEKVKDPY